MDIEKLVESDASKHPGEPTDDGLGYGGGVRMASDPAKANQKATRANKHWTKEYLSDRPAYGCN